VRLARLAALAPALALAAGCGDDDDPTGSDGVDGTYQLVAFERQAVPFSGRDEDGRTVSVRGGTLTLDDGDYQVTLDIRIDGRRAPDTDDEGRYERDDDRILFTSVDDNQFEGEVSGREISIDVGGTALRFARE
jgi:hypothetical protein